MFPSPFAVQYIAEALNQDTPRGQHIGQFAHFLRVFNGLIKRVAEVVRTQNGKISVWGLKVFVRWPFTTAKPLSVFSSAYKPARVLQKVRTLFLKAWDSRKLGLIKHIIDRFHNFVAHLHPYAYVNHARLVRYFVLWQIFSSQSAPRLPVATMVWSANISKLRPVKTITPSHRESFKIRLEHSCSNKISTPLSIK